MSKCWEFDSYVEGGDEDFISYVDRFEHYWRVTQIEDSSFERPYRTLKDLPWPREPDDKSFEDLVSVFKEHDAP
ncbi:hypothetical protein MTO96_008182 [Rhipicephalus appendiculatus]